MIPREKLAHDYLVALLMRGQYDSSDALSIAFGVADKFIAKVAADKQEADRLPMASSRPFRPGGTEK